MTALEAYERGLADGQEDVLESCRCCRHYQSHPETGWCSKLDVRTYATCSGCERREVRA